MMKNSIKSYQEFNDKYKHAADTILVDSKKGKDGSDLVFYGEDDQNKRLEYAASRPPLNECAKKRSLTDSKMRSIKSNVNEGERLRLKERIKYLSRQNNSYKNKNAKLEGELSAYKQIFKAIFDILEVKDKRY